MCAGAEDFLDLLLYKCSELVEIEFVSNIMWSMQDMCMRSSKPTLWKDIGFGIRENQSGGPQNRSQGRDSLHLVMSMGAHSFTEQGRRQRGDILA